MAKLIRVFDPEETERRINLVIPEASCPGLLEFLAEMPYRTETPLIRGIVYQWFVTHRDAGTLDAAINKALEGSGGLIEAGPPVRQAKKVPTRSRGNKAVRQRSVTAKPATRSASVAPAEEAGPPAAPVEVPQPPPAVAAVQAPPKRSPEAPPALQDEQGTRIGINAPVISSASVPLESERSGTSVSNELPTGADQPIQMPNPSEIDPAALRELEGLDTMFG
ncbi:hypothetical protein [Cupriavidus sp. TMH.W2]|uniref:hypothetical protein n=1 Tax=Cupriavidus sp. TMH.W2 TaxID=3434465 RepID=UPI003D7876D5